MQHPLGPVHPGGTRRIRPGADQPAAEVAADLVADQRADDGRGHHDQISNGSDTRPRLASTPPSTAAVSPGITKPRKIAVSPKTSAATSR